ncbi:MAG: hypothetical protein ACK56L_06365, partial [Pseudanabaena sp.]
FGGATLRVLVIYFAQVLKNRFFESPPMVGFQKTDFGISSAFGAGNTKISFIVKIAERHHKA